MKHYIGDFPHEHTIKEYSTNEIDLGELEFVTYSTAKKNAQKYIERNQKSKSSCVPSSIANALWKTENEILADEPNYKQRVNFPQEGCYWIDQLDLAVNFGMAKRVVAPEVTTEDLANKYEITKEIREDAKIHRQKSYVFIKDFNDIIRVINQGIPVVFSIGSNSKEYANDKPKVIGGTVTIQHAICAIPYTGYKNKKEYGFFITDSSHFGKTAKREITQEFYDNRKRFEGAFFVDLDLATTDNWITPPAFKGYKFTRDLTVGSRGDDVRNLQYILKSNGIFPMNISPTGYFGGITFKAVEGFQKRYEKDILTIIGLKKPTGYFGKASINKINELLK